ncbi:MAG TPA: O-GlcNAc transferase, partial [Candidatus Kryptonia bacterium]|nr:O-GlcNAc transferase [Candidatus Kryptonia bacterium]
MTRSRGRGRGIDMRAPAPPTRPVSWLPVLLLIVVTVVAYAPALHGQFLWDDDRYVSQNSTLRSLAGLSDIWLAPRESPQYYPLVFTAFWFEHQLWGPAPFGYHAVNLALHIANALLLWLVLHRLRVAGAYAAAVVFALHPVHVESVAWITERKDVLATVFSLVTIVAWLRWLDAPRVASFCATLALFIAAMLSKTIACTLPVVLLLLTWWRRPSGMRRALAGAIPLLAIGAGLARVTMWREALGDPLELPARRLSEIDRL